MNGQPRSAAGLNARTPFNLWLALSFCLLWTGAAFGQHQEVGRPTVFAGASSTNEARALVAEMLAQRPDKSTTNTGRIRVRDRAGKEREISVRFAIVATPTNWLSVYEALDPSGQTATSRVSVIHTDGAPNRYEITEPAGGSDTNGVARALTPAEAMRPFAGSDFWIADLGLDFLHWPKQRLLKREMRHSKSCNVLESVNPNPAPGSYARVESWVIIEGPPGIVHADAYDSNNQKLKEFDPVNLEKVAGQYQLEEMEMRNRQTGSHTWIKFHLSEN
jgi:hypothetical protein